MSPAAKRRIARKQASNNKENPNKNLCAEAVAEAIGVSRHVRYLHTISDLVRAARNDYIVRSRMSAANARGKTVGAIRDKLATLGARYYIVRTDDHVLLLNCEGQTVVDTAPRKRDRRKVTHVYGVYWKSDWWA